MHMFSDMVPGLDYVLSPVQDRLHQIPASLQSLFTFPTLKPYSISLSPSLFRRAWSDSGELIVWSIAGAAIIFTLSSFAWLLHSTTKKKKKKKCELTIAKATMKPSNHYTDDEKYAEELQVLEVMFVSLQMATKPSPYTLPEKTVWDPKPTKIAKEFGESSQSFCQICLENIESWQMFKNETCSHSFCYDCTRNHIVAKIKENMQLFTCPGINCKAMLDSEACRLLIPNDDLVRWDETLCRSLVDKSQTLYCPYKDCSVILVNDSGNNIREIMCPLCQRSFCVRCHVPWHSEFTCQEFRKLNGKKIGKDDVMVMELAKKKKWKKCPNCKYYVEKIEGCIHITCRCSYEFCYRCGSKWKLGHGGCS